MLTPHMIDVSTGIEVIGSMAITTAPSAKIWMLSALSVMRMRMRMTLNLRFIVVMLTRSFKSRWLKSITFSQGLTT